MRSRLVILLAAVLCLPLTPASGASSVSRNLDAAITKAVKENQIPGAVLLVSHKGTIIHRKAYGFRALEPRRERMTVDTIFDAASLTKVVATTSAVMKLFEQGKIRLSDRVTEYLPEFQGGKSTITVRDLLTHYSGLRPDLDLKPEWSGYETGVKLALADKPVCAPGTRFIYSDINFILLGEIVHRVSGKPLPVFANEQVFRPLGMKNTMFQPPAALRRRIAPTERLPGATGPLRGVVHDPTTRYMGGIAGHAGLFTTADDLARFAGMMLGMGRSGPARVFGPLVVRKFTEPQTPPHQPVLRGLGWDIDSPFSGNRGELFPIGSFGHTGFTGTSLWIDPVTRTYVILLTNSVHPKRRPPVTPLRKSVATIVAASLNMSIPAVSVTGYNEVLPGVRRAVARNGKTQTGLDVLVAQHFEQFKGKRVGLITNHTGLDRNGQRNVDLMVEAGVQLKALFSPEHGIAGLEDKPEVGHGKDPATGIPVWSLYEGENRRPTPEMLQDIDVLVFDIQDVGARFYTYISTMGYAMEEAAKHHIPFYVLDRPNPLTGIYVEGPVLDAGLESFIGYFPIPLRHGMTVGELARLFNTEKKIGADLKVISMQDWQRGDWFDSTGLTWVDPSPNMRSFNAALLYPGVAMIEASANYSVGRGTDAPFEQVGAEWIVGQDLAAELNSRFVPGVRFYPTRFRPTASNFANKWIQGVRFVITDREAFSAERLGIELAAALGKLYPEKISLDTNRKLIGNAGIIQEIQSGEEPRAIEWKEMQNLEEFKKVREKYLLYK